MYYFRLWLDYKTEAYKNLNFKNVTKLRADEIIEIYIKPRLAEECKRLGIPPSFILSIKSGYKSICRPIVENNKLEGVEIKICYELGYLGTFYDFFHEMKHAQDYWRRGLEENSSFLNEMKDEYVQTSML